MISSLDKAIVAKRFSSAARSYDANAPFQRHAAALLLSQLPDLPEGAHILDIGCGTGLLSLALQRCYSDAAVTAIDVASGMIKQCRVNENLCKNTGRMTVSQPMPQEAAEGGQKQSLPSSEGVSARELLQYYLPLHCVPADYPSLNSTGIDWQIADAETYQSEQRFDLIVSNCAVQWFTEREAIGRRLASLAQPDGLLALSLPVEGTLVELSRSIYAACGREMPGLRPWRVPEFIKVLEADAAWRLQRSTVQDITLSFKNPIDVLRHLNRIGAVCSGHDGVASLSVTALRRTLERYRERYSDGSGVSATYRVLHVHAQRGKGSL